MAMNDLQEVMKNPSIEKAANAALKRGNHIEVHSSKDGIKVFEVSKKLVATVKINNQIGRAHV